jgi:hypothetical protein
MLDGTGYGPNHAPVFVLWHEGAPENSEQVLNGSIRVPGLTRATPLLHDCSVNWDHLNLIFPVYLKLMTGFPSVNPEDVGAELLH